jgi:hypothetical protein
MSPAMDSSQYLLYSALLFSLTFFLCRLLIVPVVP